jgi:AcrR family transcriptional regulator
LSRKERQSAERANQILDAAVELFAEKGFHRTTTRDIAEAADVAEGTLYNYFANKDDLLMGIMQRLTESSSSDPGQMGPIPINAREHFASLLEFRKTFQKQNTAMMQALLSEILANADLRARYYQQILKPSITALEKSLKLHSTLEQIKPVEIPETARILTSMMMGLFFLEVLGDPIVNSTGNQLDEAIITLVFDGMSSKRK